MDIKHPFACFFILYRFGNKVSPAFCQQFPCDIPFSVDAEHDQSGHVQLVHVQVFNIFVFIFTKSCFLMRFVYNAGFSVAFEQILRQVGGGTC